MPLSCVSGWRRVAGRGRAIRWRQVRRPRRLRSPSPQVSGQWRHLVCGAITHYPIQTTLRRGHQGQYSAAQSVQVVIIAGCNYSGHFNADKDWLGQAIVSCIVKHVITVPCPAAASSGQIQIRRKIIIQSVNSC